MGSTFSQEVGAPNKHVGLREANGCRDVAFLGLFLAFWVGMFVITGFAVDQGDVNRLTHPTDSYGFLCGKDNSFQGVKFDLSDRPNLYYLNSLQLHDPRNWKFAKSICVDECPSVKDRCPPNKLPCLQNHQYRCPYYRAAENNVFGSLNFTTSDQIDFLRNVNPTNPAMFSTMFWTNTSYFSLLDASNRTKCNITLPNAATFNETIYGQFNLSSGQDVPCGPFYQASSQYNVGPCYPVWESTVEYCGKCYPDSSFFPVARSAVTVTKEMQLVGPFPVSAQRNTIKHQNQGLSSKMQQYVADLQRGWWLVLATGLAAALIFSGIFLLLIVYFPDAMIFVVLGVSILSAIGFTLWCFQEAGMLITENRYIGKYADKRLPNSLDPSELDRRIWFWIGIASVIMTVIYTIICAVFASGLTQIARAVKAAAMAITDIATLFFFPIIPFLLEAALVTYWIVVTYLIFSAGKRKANYRNPTQYRPLSVKELYKNNCPPIPGFVVYVDKDIEGGVYSTPQALDVYTLARSCNAEKELCQAFNTLGFFKDKLPPYDQWKSVKDVCLYVKAANWTMPPPLGFPSPPPAYPIVAPAEMFDANGNPIKPKKRTLDDCVLDPDCYITYAWNINLRWCFIYFLFGLIFTHHVLVGLAFLTVSGSTAYWYWRNDNMPVHPTLKAFFKSICYHLGSICLYAFLYTLLLPVYIPAKLLQRMFCNPSRTTSVSAKWVTCCCDPFVQFLDRLTLCMIGIKGKGYTESAKRAFVILVNAGGAMVAMVDTTVDFLVFTCKIAVALLCGVLTFFLVGLPRFTNSVEYGSTYICNPLFVVFIATGIAYAVADLYFAVLEAAVGVVFLSLCEDMQHHGGRPVHAPPGLAELICIMPKPSPAPSHKSSVAGSNASKKSTVKPPSSDKSSSKPSVKSNVSTKSADKPKPPPPPPSESAKSSTSHAPSSDKVKWIPGTMPPAPKPLAPLRPLPATVMSTVGHTYSPLNVSPPVPPPGYYTSYNAAYPNRYQPVPSGQQAPSGPVTATLSGTITGNFEGNLNTR